MTEGRGTGVPIIYGVMEKNGSPEPSFETDEACTYFLTVLYSHPELILDQDDQDSDQATDQELKVLKFCKQLHSRKQLKAKYEFEKSAKGEKVVIYSTIPADELTFLMEFIRPLRSPVTVRSSDKFLRIPLQITLPNR